MKHTKDHPTFQRLAEKVEQQVMVAGEKLSALFLRQNPGLLMAPNTLQDMVAKAERTLRKRLHRECGLNGKYVAH